MYDIIIVGGGPAGLTAAIYARRAGKSVLIVEKQGFGGQIAYSPRVENYPGVSAIPGAELAERMVNQALELGTETDFGTVCAVRQEGDHKQVLTQEGESYEGRCVILCCGSRHRHLGLPGEEELTGRGVSYCAVCDGAFYPGAAVAVVGGGDSALQEALLLSEICGKVFLIHRRETFRGDVEKQLRLFARKNVEVLTPMEITALHQTQGDLHSLTLRHAVTGRETELPVTALFVSIGQVPELGDFADVIPLTEAGYAAVGEDGATPTPGVFVAGDCRRKATRQVATAVGDGATAALNACRWLDEN